MARLSALHSSSLYPPGDIPGTDMQLIRTHSVLESWTPVPMVLTIEQYLNQNCFPFAALNYRPTSTICGGMNVEFYQNPGRWRSKVGWLETPDAALSPRRFLWILSQRKIHDTYSSWAANSFSLIKKSPALYGTLRFSRVFTIYSTGIFSEPKNFQSTTSHSTSSKPHF
jgi:hypothetical protein